MAHQGIFLMNLCIDNFLCEFSDFSGLEDWHRGSPFSPLRDFLGVDLESSHSVLHKFLDVDTDHLVNSFSHCAYVEEIHFVADEIPLNSKSYIQINSAVSLPLGSTSCIEEQSLLQALIDKHASLFAHTSTELGCIHPELSICHIIDTQNAKPITQRPYHHSHFEDEFLRLELDKLVSLGVIRPSKSPWLSPVVLVKKKDNTLRLCIDYRKLNDATVVDAYSLPRIEDHFNSISHNLLTSRVSNPF